MSQTNPKDSSKVKGIARIRKVEKRAEAEARNALTPPERTRAHRRKMEKQ